MLAWTPLHLDKRWIVLLESYVAIHAVIVAAWNANLFGGTEMWPMFFSGFAFMFVFTYMYAAKVSRKIYWLVTAIYVAFLAWLYLPAPFGFGRSILNLERLEFLWIPMILYGLAALFAVTSLSENKEITTLAFLYGLSAIQKTKPIIFNKGMRSLLLRITGENFVLTVSPS